MKLSNVGLFPQGIAGPVILFILVVYRVTTFLMTIIRTGHFIDYKNSNWFSAEAPHEFTLWYLVPLVGNVITYMVATMFISESIRYAGLAGVNQSVMSGILSCLGAFNSVLFYIVFDERMSWVQKSGIIVMMLWLIYVVVESGEKENMSNSNSSI